MPAATAIIADDHALVRQTLCGILESLGFQVIDELADGLDALASVKRNRPDLLLLDLAMPTMPGSEVFVEVRRWCPGTKVVLVTGMTSVRLLSELARLGADGLFLKDSDPKDIAEAIPHIMRGRRIVARSVRRRLAEVAIEPLSARELQVLSNIARGLTNAEIAIEIGLSAKTVDNHRQSIMRKLDVHSVAQLMAFAVKEGMLDGARQA